ncbi:hypothetical protein [Mycolicibacterium septicum]|nr:hypothetical protein [Mycolicibacterium septicum]
MSQEHDRGVMLSVAAVASRRAVPVVLVLIASVPFAPLALFALELAF